jgi:hypothetical protein
MSSRVHHGCARKCQASGALFSDRCRADGKTPNAAANSATRLHKKQQKNNNTKNNNTKKPKKHFFK